MPRLHDPSYCDAIKVRLRKVKPESAPKWGNMTPDQMIWHLNAALEMCLGRLGTGDANNLPLPKSWLRFMVLNMPWPNGAPTPPTMKASGKYDLEAERARCLRLIDEFTARPIDGAWPVHPILGAMRGEQYSRLQAKHLNHHLTQFGA